MQLPGSRKVFAKDKTQLWLVMISSPAPGMVQKTEKKLNKIRQGHIDNIDKASYVDYVSNK